MMNLKRYYFDVIDEKSHERLIPSNYGIVATSERIARQKFESRIVTNAAITVKVAKIEDVLPFQERK